MKQFLLHKHCPKNKSTDYDLMLKNQCYLFTHSAKKKTQTNLTNVDKIIHRLLYLYTWRRSENRTTVDQFGKKDVWTLWHTNVLFPHTSTNAVYKKKIIVLIQIVCKLLQTDQKGRRRMMR